MYENKVKAAVLKEFGKLEIREFPYPKDLEEGAILVEMVYAGICGTDKHLFEGKNKNIPLPIILGHENIARIERITEKARTDAEITGKNLKEGDIITWNPALACGECWYCKWLPQNHPGMLCESLRMEYGSVNCENPPHLFGGYAEKVYLKPGVWVWKIPENLPNKVAVLLDTFASVEGVRKAMNPYPAVKEGFGPGDTVVIQGSGAIGFAAALTAKLCGAYRIILIGGPKSRLRIAEEFHVIDHMINIDETTSKERLNIIKQLTDGIGADMVVDCTGVPGAVPEGIDMLRRAGTFVEIGSFCDTGDISINPFRHLCHKDIQIIGQYGYSQHCYVLA